MTFDALVIGAGGAGMMFAARAGARGKRIAVIDHAEKVGAKILISGGGRCNFTNIHTNASHFVSNDPNFCTHALSQFRPNDFLAMIKKHKIRYHEKKLGQLFCDVSARDIVAMLQTEAQNNGAKFFLGKTLGSVTRIESQPPNFSVIFGEQQFSAPKLVIASGGLSIPKIGATGIGYQIARQFGLKVTKTVPALDGFTFTDTDVASFSALAGLSLDCIMSAGGKSFRENLLFTHRGLSGPAALQCSLHWNLGDPINIDLLPEKDIFQELLAKKRAGTNRMALKNILAFYMPARFAEYFCARHFESKTTLHEIDNVMLKQLCVELKTWQLYPKGTVGFGKAEVTRGGISTRELDPTTMESKRVSGLYFIGEVVDVTGWLGGFNFQWAWASATAAANHC